MNYHIEQYPKVLTAIKLFSFLVLCCKRDPTREAVVEVEDVVPDSVICPPIDTSIYCRHDSSPQLMNTSKRCSKP